MPASTDPREPAGPDMPGSPLPSMREWCGCFSALPPSRALRDILDELRELATEPSRDEASDVAFGVGRLLGALVKRPYVPVPYARLHIEKVAHRMLEHGCIRSRRHLVDGRCPARGGQPS